MHDFKRFEAMAKLDLPEEERVILAEKAQSLLERFRAVEKIDAAGAEPLVTVLNIRSVLREDIPSQIISRDELLANAPAEYDGYFQVPKTLD